MTRYRIFQDGEENIVTLPDGAALEEQWWAAFDPVSIDAAPDEFDVWDAQAGRYVLDPAKANAHLHARIDAEAGAFRCRFITDVPGQQATYLDKEREARAWAAEADPAGFPRLAAEAEVRSIPIADMAGLIVQTADQWRALDVNIEAKRIALKLAVTAAETAEAKRAAAIFDWNTLLDPEAPPPDVGGEIEEPGNG